MDLNLISSGWDTPSIAEAISKLNQDLGVVATGILNDRDHEYELNCSLLGICVR